MRFRTGSVRRKCGDRCPAFVLVSSVLFVLALNAEGFPAVRLRSGGNEDLSDLSQAVVFLTRFGYLPPSDPKTGNLRSEAELRSAVATMQRFGGLRATGLVDGETAQLMRRKRCGVPDILTLDDDGRWRLRRYAIQGQKWPSNNLTWSVKSEGSVSASDAGMVRAQLRRAFSVWSEASALTFSEVELSKERRSADILVSFLSGPHGDGYPFDGEGSVLAHAFFPGEGIGGDAHFDAEERWLPTQPPREDDGVNLFAVAAHEIGHSLGLSHSSTPGSLMFPYYQVIGEERFKLPDDDADGIRHLYGSKNGKNTLPPPTMPDLAPTTFSPTTTTLLTTTQAVDGMSTVTPQQGQTTSMAPPTAPDICNSSIDAISVIRREIFVFKGNFFWRLHTNRTLRSGYPVSIDRFWYDLPPNITRIDALYERPTDTKIVFFSGRRYWLFSANQLEPGYPKPLTDLGLPADVERVDAALVWGHNGKTYLFSGDIYWKLDETEGKVELDYPRSIAAWRGVPRDIDAAFQWTDGNTYFFKGRKFWKFVDVKMRVEKKPPSEIGGFWFHCPSQTVDSAMTAATVASETDARQFTATSSSSSLCGPSPVLSSCLVCCLFLACFVNSLVSDGTIRKIKML